MKIGMVTDSLSHLSLDEMLDFAAQQEIDCIELNAGNWGTTTHLGEPAELIESKQRRREILAKIKDRGLSISALNANGNQLHPVSGPQHAQRIEETIELAALLEVERVVMMSGLPAGGPQDRTPNWVVSSWPTETQQILDYQWNEIAIPYWRRLDEFAASHDVQQLCIEAHGNQLVYNAPTFLRLRDAIGPRIGLNLDPSHLIWMGGDPIAMVEQCADYIYHVHAKDAALDARNVALNTRLDHQPMAHQTNRAWSYLTLGYGQDEHWWRRFGYALQTAGLGDRVLSIEHEDMQLSRCEGVRRSVELLRRCIPREAADYQLPE
ncbi:sugar phosphate isomerase/epimerase family protein [Carnimonas nigrificans]|uniref:sugar phosphate isomerase/epimerase family protein n=1 Tax=Carnimonas nigrificans TaxID=64323 RepID=UPI000472A72A|nr:sugar phosphate isomerase/epimerase [Carnimonas nigrificans]